MIKKNLRKYYHRRIYNMIKSSSSKNVMRILSIRRSGQHAIINWLQNQISGTIYFHNNVYPERELFASINNKAKLRFFQKGMLLMYNIENPQLEKIEVLGEGKYVGKKSILIIRDPYNCFASYLNANWEWNTDFRDKKEFRNHIKSLWKTHAREALHDTSLINNKCVISYNKWASSKEYRVDLARELGFEFTDQGINYTPHYGRGSSFKDNPSDYFSRWQYFQNDERYLAIFRGDSELQELSQRLFGKMVGTEILY